MATVKNQKVAIIHRIELDNPKRKNITGDGLGHISINNKSWRETAKDLGAQAFLLYLFFVGNADGFLFEISPQRVKNEIGMPISTFRDQIKILEKKGYLVHKVGNVYDFYEYPKTQCTSKKAEGEDTQSDVMKTFEETLAIFEKTEGVPTQTPEDRDINNKNSVEKNIQVVFNDVEDNFHKSILRDCTDENGNFRF